MGILVYDRELINKQAIECPPNDMVSAPNEIWYKALKFLRPKQYKKIEKSTIMYIQFSYYDRIGKKNYIDNVLVCVLKNIRGSKLVSVSIPGVYGYGYGPTVPFRYYWLLENNEVTPIKFDCQMLINDLPNNPNESLRDYSKWKDITSFYLIHVYII